ncbi:glycosyltransferase [Candidatus Gottesmanbacteria bacterium]|nr:glycosyltransferase [Candidatus Gottesmanbacteria bacterium]
MSDDKPKKLSLIIPVYNQEKIIVSNLENILKELKKLTYQYEVIVVVDGMNDSSFDKAKSVKSDSITVVGYKTNKGKGYAVRYGMAKSSGDIIGFMDSGGDIKEEGLSMLLEHFRWYNADIVVGSKRHPVSKVNYPFFRVILSFGYQMIIRILFGLKIRDTQVGLKLYRREVLEDVLPRLIVKKFAFDIEILAVAYHLGYTRIFEAPVDLDFTGVSSITSKNFRSIVFGTLVDTLAVFYRLRILRYYDNANKRKWRFDPELNFRVNTWT